MMTLSNVTPILRIFDEAKAREFYVGFLGFTIDFEHRYGDNFPLYMGISHGSCLLHLSEHHGDSCPGAAIRIATNNVAALCTEMLAKNYKYAKPGAPEPTSWGEPELTITDPFGNKLTFYQVLTG
jgi:uncharacterized glyoxalase superfamily protein PhnB